MIVSGPSDLLDDVNVVLSGGVFSVFGATCVPVCYSCGPSLAAFQIAPAAIQSTVGGTTQMVATVTISTGAKLTETASTKWSSKSPPRASVASGGMVTAVAAVTTTIDGVIDWADEASTCYPIACTTLAYEGEAPTTVAATPTNFQQTDTTDLGNGDLHFEYTWESTTGNLADLSNCHVFEEVTYPGGDPFTFPAPFPAITVNNPTPSQPPIPGTAGALDDENGLQSTVFIKPLFAASFTATQTFNYSCSISGAVLNGQLLGPLSIVRSVSQNTNGTWKFTVTKPTNGVATINPIP